MKQVERYLMEAPLPTNNYERLVMGLVLVVTAQTKDEFNQAEQLCYELSDLLDNEVVERAIKYVAGLDPEEADAVGASG